RPLPARRRATWRNRQQPGQPRAADDRPRPGAAPDSDRPGENQNRHPHFHVRRRKTVAAYLRPDHPSPEQPGPTTAATPAAGPGPRDGRAAAGQVSRSRLGTLSTRILSFMPPTVLGLDVGGANLKAATNAGFAVQTPFALWKHPERLANALRRLINDVPP